ncbi:hypothetical protein HY640_04500 [Candidatus Woesearchaeota archaeon]|nr:hypothetical protein [Candidatus Woesearchaeota archaeon]
MGIEEVKEEITAEARRQAAETIASARKEAERITKAASQQEEEKKKTAIKQLEEQLAMNNQKELAAAEIDSSKSILEAKKKAVEEAFNEAANRIAKSTPAQRKEHIKRLLEKANEQIQISKVCCSEKDLKHIDGVRAEPRNLTGGIIAENKEGTIRIDYSYDAILEKVKEEKLKDVAKTLFRQ